MHLRSTIVAVLAALSALLLVGGVMRQRPAPAPPVTRAQLIEDLRGSRDWVTFEPPLPFVPGQLAASAAQLRGCLRQLRGEGFGGLITYAMDPREGLDVVPRLARQAGFRRVIVGLYGSDRAMFERELAACRRARIWIDGYVVGNEGLDRLYTFEELARRIAAVRAMDPGKAVTTTEVDARYQTGGPLCALGDWLYPNLHRFAGRDPAAAAREVARRYAQIQAAGQRPVAIKETWFPSVGPGGEQRQADFYNALLATTTANGGPVPFAWGEAYDQAWKHERQAGQDVGPHFGLHTADRRAKQVLRQGSARP